MRWMMILIGVLVVLGGLLPLLKSHLPGTLSFLPTEGMGYQAVIILIGLVAIIYGVKKKRVVFKR